MTSSRGQSSTPTVTPGGAVVVDSIAVLSWASPSSAGVGELLHSATIAVTAHVPIDRLWHTVPTFPPSVRSGCDCSKPSATRNRSIGPRGEFTIHVCHRRHRQSAWKIRATSVRSDVPRCSGALPQQTPIQEGAINDHLPKPVQRQRNPSSRGHRHDSKRPGSIRTRRCHRLDRRAEVRQFQGTPDSAAIANSPFMGWLYNIFPYTRSQRYWSLRIHRCGVDRHQAVVREALRRGQPPGDRAVRRHDQLPVTTPGVSEPAGGGFPALSLTGEFLLKDLPLLGLSFWTLANSIRAARTTPHAFPAHPKREDYPRAQIAHR